MTASPRELLARFQQAMLDFSADALADLFAQDAIYEFPFLAPQREAQRYEGREQIRAGFTRAWGTVTGSPVLGFRDVRVHDTADPAVIVAEGEFEAIDHATGHRFTSGFVLVLTARDGQIVHIRDYSDVLRVSRRLGRLPELLDHLRDEEPTYALSEVRPLDSVQFDRYCTLAADSITRHGGRYLVRGGPVEAAEGDWPDDATVVLVEFPSRSRLEQWYHSADYAEALQARAVGLDRRLLFLEHAPNTVQAGGATERGSMK